MKIAIISRANIKDVSYWSGAIENIYHALKIKNDKLQIIKIDNLNNTLRKIFAFKREIFKYFKNEKFDDAYNDSVSKNFSHQIDKKLKKFENINYILCFDTSLISYLRTDIPIILWTDLLYSQYYNHYFQKQKISKKTVKSIKRIESLAIKKTNKVFLPTKWALIEAKKKYKKYSKKFHLLHFGPNFKNQIAKKNIRKIISKRSNKKLLLTTLSVDWQRKGIHKIINLKKILDKRGIEVELFIIGLNNRTKIKDKNINIIPFINKNTKNGEKLISNYLVNSHFHILFSNAEAYGISLIEANSRGVPNICFNVGGIPSVVKNETNGKVFKRNQNLNKIAEYIYKIFINKKRYQKLSLSSYNYFYNNYRYDKIIDRFIYLIKK